MKVILDDGAFMPVRAHDTDAGLDLKSPESVTIEAHSSKVINTGVHVQLPPGTAGMLVSKSGLNVKYGITSTGLIDEGYTGSIRVKLYNNSSQSYKVERGNKITQLVVIPVMYVDVEIGNEFDTDTERGDNGFGSTGA